MISRHCKGLTLRFLKKTKTSRSKTLQYLGGFRKIYIASGELSKETRSMLDICLTNIKYPLSHKSFSRDNSTYSEIIKPVVVHDPIGKRFYIDLNGMGRAYLQYEQLGRLIRITHTEVPKAFAGLGYGKLLAQEALEFVAENDYQLEIYCVFVRDYIRKYAPQYLKYMKN